MSEITPEKYLAVDCSNCQSKWDCPFVTDPSESRVAYLTDVSPRLTKIISTDGVAEFVSGHCLEANKRVASDLGGYEEFPTDGERSIHEIRIEYDLEKADVFDFDQALRRPDAPEEITNAIREMSDHWGDDQPKWGIPRQ